MVSSTGGDINSSRPLLILGIESSCDDTGAAVVTSSGTVLGETLATQADIHAQWGGVVPSLAKEAHQAAIDRVVDEALQQAQLTADQLDAVAVTIGPGLSLCLDVGVRKARAVCRSAGIPLVPIHHMEAHALIARMTAGGPAALTFPFLCLLVRGSWSATQWRATLNYDPTDYVAATASATAYSALPDTVTAALHCSLSGPFVSREAYDKIARMLGLELKPHGGAVLEALALQGDPNRYRFGVPMKKHANCDFSYAGLKTSVRLCIERELGEPSTSQQGQQQVNADQHQVNADQHQVNTGQQQVKADQDQVKADIAASFQRVAVDHLCQRVKRGVSWAREAEPNITQLVVAGGVASNKYVRQRLTDLAESERLQLVFPPARWCTDNGVMVAWAGVERWVMMYRTGQGFG
eukprot:jgi/Chrzof1/12387/Cz06g32180.t1